MRKKMELEFRPIAELPRDYADEIVVRGGEEYSGFKLRPYMIHAVYCDLDGRYWVGLGHEIEIIGPTEFSYIPFV